MDPTPATNPCGTQRPTPARDHVVALTVLAAAMALTWANALGAGFVRDAWGFIVANPVIHSATLENVRFILTHDHAAPVGASGLYRPLTVLSYLFDWAIVGHGDRPAGYIAENILLHFLCAALVYALVWQLLGRLWPAAVAAALFGLHPVTTEAVVNVAGRADLLATLGVLGGLACYVHGSAARGRRRAGWAAGLVAASVVAFFAKESGLVLVAGHPALGPHLRPPASARACAGRIGAHQLPRRALARRAVRPAGR